MMKQFKPMLCEKAEMKQVEDGLFDDDGVWIAQRKYDGIRAYVKQEKLYNRRGDDITKQFPEFAVLLEAMQGSNLICDGEIVADSEEFKDVVGRIHLRDKLFIRIASQSNPCTFVLFDCIEQDRKEPRVFADRYKLVHVHKALRTLNPKAKRVERLTIAENSRKPSELLEKAKQEGWEGIVLKKLNSIYYNGRSFDWRKVKLFKEIEYSFSEFEEHPKGILLKDGDRKVNVNGKESEVVRNIINKKGKVVVEVQYLPQKHNDKWRFPSFRGVVKEVGK